MTTPDSRQREFRCQHCNGKILVPRTLPATTGPCPHCHQQITSPEPDAESALDPMFEEGGEEDAGKTTANQVGEPAARGEEPPVRGGGAEPVGGSAGSESAPAGGGDRQPEPVPEGEGDGGDPFDPPPARKRVPVVPIIIMVVLLALAGGVLFLALWSGGGESAPPAVDPERVAQVREEQYIEGGWEADAREVLGRFVEARTPAGKAAYSLRGAELLGEMESFYRNHPLDDSDTPAEAFTVFPLGEDDRREGIFMLHFDQPPVFDLGEFFVPLSPLEVEYQTERPDLLLSAVARSSNFTGDSLKVYALFKKTEAGLRLDWETFVQTKHRLMRDFLELPVRGRSEVFRVIMQETVSESRQVPAGSRTYLVSDPAHRNEDAARIDVAVDSEVGQALSVLNWRGTGDSSMVSRTATVELRWTDEETPRLELSRFICWEFLGVGTEVADAR